MSTPHIEVQLPSGKYLLVKVPDNSREHYLLDCANKDGQGLFWKDGSRSPAWVVLPEAHTYTIIGKENELTEEQWVGIVSDISFLQPNPHNIEKDEVVNCWEDYTDTSEQLVCYTATESGHSLIRSKGQIPEEILIIKID